MIANSCTHINDANTVENDQFDTILNYQYNIVLSK